LGQSGIALDAERTFLKQLSNNQSQRLKSILKPPDVAFGG
jgi:hypothetical protein